MDEMFVWIAPAIIKPEFRLYYDDSGRVLFYTCEKPEGKYIVIDSSTYAQSRPDIRVVDGKIVTTASAGAVVAKLTTSSTGVRCAKQDISVIVDDDYTGETTNWELIINAH